MKIEKKWVEVIFLIVFLGSLFFIGPFNLLGQSITHEYPYSLSAADAFFSVRLAEHIKDSGEYKYNPAYMGFGNEDMLACNPPVTYMSPALQSIMSGIETYNLIIFFMYLISILTVIVLYLLIRKYSIEFAMVSAPISLFLFLIANNVIGFVWGIWSAMSGSFMMLITLLILQNLDRKNFEILLAISLIGTIFANPGYFIFTLLFIITYQIIYYIKYKEVQKVWLKKLVVPVALSIILSLPYLIVFFNTSYAYQGGNYNFFDFASPAQDSSSMWVLFTDLGPFLGVVIIGAVIGAYLLITKTKKDKDLFFILMTGFFLMTIMLGNYGLGFGQRAFKARYHLPIYVMIFFGFAIYYLLLNLKKHENTMLAAGIGIGCCALIIVMNPLVASSRGIMDPYYDNTFDWIKTNTPQDSVILMYYAPFLDQGGFAYNTDRVNVIVDYNDYLEKFQRGAISNKYVIRPHYEGGCNLVKSSGFMNFETVSIPDNLKGLQSICDYEFHLILFNPNFDPWMPQVVYYNQAIRDVLMKNEDIDEVFNNGVFSILRNKNPGQLCIEEIKKDDTAN